MSTHREQDAHGLIGTKSEKVLMAERRYVHTMPNAILQCLNDGKIGQLLDESASDTVVQGEPRKPV